jgi:hypothetical protein
MNYGNVMGGGLGGYSRGGFGGGQMGGQNQGQFMSPMGGFQQHSLHMKDVLLLKIMVGFPQQTHFLTHI